jgi:predicted  nucleic acid-binding Zn-ribbon protein
LELDYAQKIDDNTAINQELVDCKNRMNNNIEKIQSLIREIALKNQQIVDYDDRVKKSQDDIDLAQYKLQEQQKDITEMKLKTDILTTTNDSLMSEKSHLTTELKETRQLQRTYE